MVGIASHHDVLVKDDFDEFHSDGDNGYPTEVPSDYAFGPVTISIGPDGPVWNTEPPPPWFEGHAPWTSLNQPVDTPTAIPTTFVTSPSNSHLQTPYSDNSGPTPSPTLLSLPIGGSEPTPTTTQGNANDGQFGLQQNRSPNHGLTHVLAAVVPVVVVGIVGAIAFVCVRRRRQRKARIVAAGPVKEIKRPHTNETIYYLPHDVEPVVEARQLASPHEQPLLSPLAAPPPVILGPIGHEHNGTYYTGLDPSDVMSVHSHTGLGNPFADGNSIDGDEPPPPYRARSIALSSRNSSLRGPPSYRTGAPSFTRTNRSSHWERSPFDDPENDSVSEISRTMSSRSHDRLSVVSDLSIQEEPMVTTRSAI